MVEKNGNKIKKTSFLIPENLKNTASAQLCWERTFVWYASGREGINNIYVTQRLAERKVGVRSLQSWALAFFSCIAREKFHFIIFYQSFFWLNLVVLVVSAQKKAIFRAEHLCFALKATFLTESTASAQLWRSAISGQTSKRSQPAVWQHAAPRTYIFFTAHWQFSPAWRPSMLFSQINMLLQLWVKGTFAPQFNLWFLGSK